MHLLQPISELTHGQDGGKAEGERRAGRASIAQESAVNAPEMPYVCNSPLSGETQDLWGGRPHSEILFYRWEPEFPLHLLTCFTSPPTLFFFELGNCGFCSFSEDLQSQCNLRENHLHRPASCRFSPGIWHTHTHTHIHIHVCVCVCLWYRRRYTHVAYCVIQITQGLGRTRH